LAGYTLKMWERIAGIHDGLSGQVILDLGSGPGRFTDIVRQKGAECIGIDYSAAVVACAAENFVGDPGVCLCQASALNLPIKDESLDGVFSTGVLHHTPDPFRGVQDASKVIKPGGWLALAVYGKDHGYDAVVLHLWR
jgi:ubiquinone/menaquinone biosynthesis C-methylase UbiE